MQEKIAAAIRYYEQYRDHGTSKEIKNDAANIYAASYDEYLTIWEALAKI